MKTPASKAESRKGTKSKAVARAIADNAVGDVLELHEAPADGLASIDAELRHEMIETAAYFIAEQRGFAPGHELDDWRAAEESVNAALLRTLQRG